ncbi:MULTISPECIES: acyltransferase family protein [unclassified Streptomyces]|uniref:acyltransferase family protein n=1 Tax=unclassified Streptomyces TaxID=2593676 RepID=UPI002365ACCB|nr:MULTISPECIES: acyltransferase family protein [unclassified Streptomyces]MDF3143544.1 acyltransferase family protein [Streptomyces sp. T21Q-yed]WDF43750.1 acyltransferase family protein [Streptomyces sp. T12]
MSADATPVPTVTRAPQRQQQPLPSAGARARRVDQRDPFLDNAKYLAIVLVAVGHAWEPLREGSRAVTTLYLLVYAFHMPAFAVISGYFSRGFEAEPRKIGRLLTGVALPYVVFEVAYTLFTRWTSQDPDRPISLLDPLYLTWFLAALFIWRLTAPLWRLVRWPLPLALALAMLATLSPSIGDDLGLQRVLQFLPYFVLGLLLKPEHFRPVRRRAARVLALPSLVCALAVAYWAVPRMNYAWFFHSDSAEELAAPAWYGPVMTLATFGCSVVLVACFLAWVPVRRTWFTVLGAGTLCGFLLHGFVAQAAKYWGWYDPAWIRQPAGELTVTLVAALVMTALCAPVVQRVFRRVTEPRMAYALRDRELRFGHKRRARRGRTVRPRSGG